MRWRRLHMTVGLLQLLASLRGRYGQTTVALLLLLLLLLLVLRVLQHGQTTAGLLLLLL